MLYVVKMGKKLQRIDDRKRITLPPEVLSILKAEAGDYVIFKETDGHIQIVKVKISEQ